MPVFRAFGSLFEEQPLLEVRDLMDPADVRVVLSERELFLIDRGSGRLVRVAPCFERGAGLRLGYFLRNPLALEDQLAVLRQMAPRRAEACTVPGGRGV